jgi:hypothetical protein
MSLVSDGVCVDVARTLQLTACLQARHDVGTAEAILVFKQLRTMSRKTHQFRSGDRESHFCWRWPFASRRDTEYSQRFSVVLFIPSNRKVNTLKWSTPGSYHSLVIPQFDSKRIEIVTVSLNESQPNTILRSGSINLEAGTGLQMDRRTGTI